jgi:hypothetical protein
MIDGTGGTKLNAASWVATRDDLISTDPFTHLNVPTPDQNKAWRAQLDRQGVRLLPPPFGHGVAVLSDIDDSDRERSGLYHGQLIEEHGLDFGDSMWLFGRTIGVYEQTAEGIPGIRTFPGLGIHHPGSNDHDWNRDDLQVTRSPREMIAGVLRGDFDHFHSFMPCGSRLVWLTQPTVEDCDAVFRIGPMARKGYGMAAEIRVAALGVIGEPNAVAQVVVGRARGRVRTQSPVSPPPQTVSFGPYDSDRPVPIFGQADEASAWLVPSSPADADHPMIHLWASDEIRIRCQSPEAAAGLRAVAIANVHRSLIFEALRELRVFWNIETSLITEHSGYFFLNQKSLAFHQAKAVTETRRVEEANPELLHSVRIGFVDGPRRFSALGDDPESFAYLFPALTRDFGFRFINAGGLTASPDYSYDATNVVAPSLARDGTGVYICRRMLPTLPEGIDPKDEVLRFARAPSFGVRLTKLFELMADSPGRLWPIYTHLGGIQPLDQSPVPYLDAEPVRELQDRVYNMSGTVKPADRCWFVRGTGMCEHSMLMQRLGSQIERPDPDTVIIRKWHDDILGYDLPVSVNQTYGLTFKVRNLARARVLLEDQPIEPLARFAHRDGNWVTAMPSVIREVVVGSVNPLTRPDVDARLERLNAKWEQDMLTLAGSWRGLGRASFAPCWINADGMQALSYRVGPVGRKAALAVLIETQDGGRFAFGDSKLIKTLDGLTAWRPETVPERGVVTVPFWDMQWADGATPGGPLPMRRLARFSLLVRGTVRLSEMSFLRPSPAQRDEPERGVVVAGSVPPDQAEDWTVTLETPDGSKQTCRPDPVGCFAFSGINAPMCRLWAEDPSGCRVAPIGGEMVETRWNQTAVRFAGVGRGGAG